MRDARWKLLATAVVLAALQTTRAAAQVRDSAQAAPPFDQAAALAELRKFIAGREEMPAVEVFNNVQQYRNATAGRFLRIMEFGFTVALGVDCTHCHRPGAWDSDEKPTKQIAREMSVMMAAINNEHLRRIPNLRSTNPQVNCTTCHRGQRRPALELPPTIRPPG
ncbi:MAG: c-type cytochrome [Gemmatimonadaceae bacterium]|nr:c-type cytochrome [Gemmatimonadaceae bacterium]